MNEQNLFRIGAFYRDESGQVVELLEGSRFAKADPGMAWCKLAGSKHGDGFRNLANGLDQSCCRRDNGSYRHLIPGELHQVNGEWIPIAAPRADYFAEALKDEPASEWDAEDNHRANDRAWAEWDRVRAELDAAMIARDGATPPKAPPIAAATPTNAHPAIPGLSRMSGGDWRLGAGLVG